MTKEQEEAIEIIDKMIKSYIEADECGLSNNDFKHEIRAMQTVLSMLQEQQEENKKKDKIINNAITEVENIRQYFSEDLQPEFIGVLEILKDKKVIDW
jgi:hypothetical protein